MKVGEEVAYITMKKYIYIALIVTVLIGATWIYAKWDSNEVQYVSQEVIKEVKVNPLEGQYAAREQELEEKYRNIQSIEARLDVNKAEILRLTEENKTLTKELANFMIGTQSER